MTPALVRSMIPPAAPARAVSSRVTGDGDASRSRTLHALDVSALMTARLNARAAREWSRPVTTVAPLSSVVAYAEVSRTTSSGVISTLTMPDTPRAPNRLR